MQRKQLLKDRTMLSAQLGMCLTCVPAFWKESGTLQINLGPVFGEGKSKKKTCIGQFPT
jgi:hypothetical protein